MTTLKDVVTNASIKGVLEALLRIYPDQAEMIDDYGKVLEFLLNAAPSENTDHMYLSVTQSYDECQWCEKRTAKGIDICSDCTQADSDKYFDVSGWVDDGTNVRYGIEYAPWEEWLGIYVSDETLAKFTKEEIVAHAMWEMTFISFDPTEIQSTLDSLRSRVKEIDEAIENGDTSMLKSIDELFDDSEGE